MFDTCVTYKINVFFVNTYGDLTAMATDQKDIKDIKKFFNSYSKGFSSIYTEDDKSRNLFNKLMDKWFRET